jgi:sulfur-oxidizing protein SoxY
MGIVLRRRSAVAGFLSIALCGLGGVARAAIKSGDNPEGSEIWQKVRLSLFQSRPIEAVANDAADALIALDTPVRADDAAVVPIAVRTRAPQAAGRSIARLWLVIDNNPSPIAAIFSFTPESGRADIETRVRIDEYTFVRAIAETDDGRLSMVVRWVKASGGCSAPPGKDPNAALATLGRMKFRIEGEPVVGQPALAQLMVSHPNHSGLAMDQLSRQFTPSHFVRRIDIAYAGRPVLSADLDFSISENPNLRFHFLPRGDGELKATVVDSHDLQFESTLAYRVPR